MIVIDMIQRHLVICDSTDKIIDRLLVLIINNGILTRQVTRIINGI
jgi:hypothetical protein